MCLSGVSHGEGDGAGERHVLGYGEEEGDELSAQCNYCLQPGHRLSPKPVRFCVIIIRGLRLMTIFSWGWLPVR